MIEELKPCPFCGTQPTGYDQIGYSSVKCKPCNFSIKVKSVDGPPYAPELWNTRATNPAPAEQVEVDAVEYQQLSRYGNWDRVDKAVYDLGKLGESREKFRALYTHPATVPAGCKVVPVDLLRRLVRATGTVYGMASEAKSVMAPEYAKTHDEGRAILGAKYE